MDRIARFALPLAAVAALAVSGCGLGGHHEAPDPFGPPAQFTTELIRAEMDQAAAAESCTAGARDSGRAEVCWYRLGGRLVCYSSSLTAAGGHRTEQTFWYRDGAPRLSRTVDTTPGARADVVTTAQVLWTPEGRTAWAGARDGAHWRATTPAESTWIETTLLPRARTALADAGGAPLH